MKKIISGFLLMSLLFVGCSKEKELRVLSQIEQPKEQKRWAATTQLFFSTDGGSTYKENYKQFSVDSVVDMKVVMKVETNTFLKKTYKPITVKISIPNITEVNAIKDGGQPVPGIADELNHITTYTFTIMGSKNPKEEKMDFRFIPNAPCDAEIIVEYDGQLSEKYDQMKLVHFVEE